MTANLSPWTQAKQSRFLLHARKGKDLVRFINTVSHGIGAFSPLMLCTLLFNRSNNGASTTFFRRLFHNYFPLIVNLNFHMLSWLPYTALNQPRQFLTLLGVYTLKKLVNGYHLCPFFSCHLANIDSDFL